MRLLCYLLLMAPLLRRPRTYIVGHGSWGFRVPGRQRAPSSERGESGGSLPGALPYASSEA